MDLIQSLVSYSPLAFFSLASIILLLFVAEKGIQYGKGLYRKCFRVKPVATGPSRMDLLQGSVSSLSTRMSALEDMCGSLFTLLKIEPYYEYGALKARKVKKQRK